MGLVRSGQVGPLYYQFSLVYTAVKLQFAGVVPQSVYTCLNPAAKWKEYLAFLQSHPSPALGLMRQARQPDCAVLKLSWAFMTQWLSSQEVPPALTYPHLASGCLLLLSLRHLLNPRVRQFRNMNQQTANSVGKKKGGGDKDKNYLPEFFTWSQINTSSVVGKRRTVYMTAGEKNRPPVSTATCSV